MKKYILAACALWFAGQALAADFSGNWGYEQELEDGIYGKYFNIKQSPKYTISGEWNEGRSNGPGGSGKVKGYVKRGKLYLSYCSEGDDSWYTHCPKYEKTADISCGETGSLSSITVCTESAMNTERAMCSPDKKKKQPAHPNKQKVLGFGFQVQH